MKIPRSLIRAILNIAIISGSKPFFKFIKPVVVFGYRLARIRFARLSDPSGPLIAKILQIIDPDTDIASPLAGEYLGLFTGRAISIHDRNNPRRPFTPNEIGLNCSNIEECEKIICEDIFEKISNIISRYKGEIDEVLTELNNALKVIKNDDIKHKIVHEVLHAIIAQNTSATTYIEGVGWRVRFDMMYVLEKIYRSIGRDLAQEVENRGFKVHEEFRDISSFEGLNEDDAENILKKLENKLDELSRDALLRTALSDGFRHQVFLKTFVGTIVIPVLETATWYLLDYDLNNTINIYEDEGFFDPELHSIIASEITQILESRRPEKQKVLEAAKATLDLPIRYYEDIKEKMMSLSSRRDVADNLKKIICNRFKRALNGESIERASNQYKTLISIMIYGAPIDKIPDIIPMFVEILNNEPMIKNELLKIFEGKRGTSVGTYTSFFITLAIENNIETIAYDPLSDLTCRSKRLNQGIIGKYVKRTGRIFGTFEDLIGDLPLALRGFLTASYILSRRDVEREKRIREIAGITEIDIGKLSDLAGRVGRMGTTFDELLNEPNDRVVKDILGIFLYSVLRFGKDVRNFGGSHAIWLL